MIKSIFDEAEEWRSHVDKNGNSAFTSYDIKEAHMAGQRVGETRVLDLLRSETATKLDTGTGYYSGPEDWATWLEKSLRTTLKGDK